MEKAATRMNASRLDYIHWWVVWYNEFVNPVNPDLLLSMCVRIQTMQHVQAQNSGLLLSMFGHRLCSVYRLKILICCYPCLSGHRLCSMCRLKIQVCCYPCVSGHRLRSMCSLWIQICVYSQVMQHVLSLNSDLLLSMFVWSQALQFVQALNSDLLISMFCLVTGYAVCTGSEFRSIDIHVLFGYRLCSMYRLWIQICW